MAAGLDSVTATELSQLVGKRLGVELSSTLLFDHPTTISLARFISSACGTTISTPGAGLIAEIAPSLPSLHH